MLFKKFIFTFISLFLVNSTAWPSQVLFSSIISEMEGHIEDASERTFEAKELANFLNGVYGQAYSLDFERVDLDDLKHNADNYMARLFNLQIVLQSRLLNDWSKQGLLNSPVALESYYKVLRTVRYTIDFIGEAKHNFPRFSGDIEVSTAFENGEFSMVLGGNPDNLPSGTLFLVRGSAANSAAIARITSISDGQFSHLGIMHKDAKGQKSIVEALIEKGLVKNAYDYAMNHGVVRAQTFIFQEPELFTDAANIAHAFAVASQPVPYNFTMIPLTLEQDPFTYGYFCSDNVGHAALIASEGDVRIPMYKSSIPLNSFTMSLGVQAEKTFAPSDIQSDPRFTPGPEWRDFRFTEKVRLQDLILDHMLDAIDIGWFSFVPGVKYRAGAGIIKALSRTPFVREFSMLSDIPKNMTRKTLRYVLMLHFSTNKIFKIVSEANDKHLLEKGFPMSPKKVDEFIVKLLL